MNYRQSLPRQLWMVAAVSGCNKYLNSTIQILSVSCFYFRANHPPSPLWQQQSAWPCGQCQQAARSWWAWALMTRWLVSFSFLRKRLSNFIPIIVCFEKFWMTVKKKKLQGQLNCFYSPPSRLLSHALGVMVDRKEIKWTIYCLLRGGLRQWKREQERDTAGLGNRNLCFSFSLLLWVSTAHSSIDPFFFTFSTAFALFSLWKNEKKIILQTWRDK